MNMNHNEEVPDFLGGLGDMLPADVLKKVNELLEQLHRKGKSHQGSTVFIYAPGSQYVENQIIVGEEPHPKQQTLFGPFPSEARRPVTFPKGKGAESSSPDSELQIRDSRPSNSCVPSVASDQRSSGKFAGTGAYPAPDPAPKRGGELLPEVLRTEKAMALWRKVQAAGYVDEQYQPTISRTQAALLADAMAERLGIKEKWKVFEGLWHRKYMYHDYYRAMEQQQSLDFQDTLKRLFE